MSVVQMSPGLSTIGEGSASQHSSGEGYAVHHPGAPVPRSYPLVGSLSEDDQPHESGQPGEARNGTADMGYAACAMMGAPAVGLLRGGSGIPYSMASTGMGGEYSGACWPG